MYIMYLMYYHYNVMYDCMCIYIYTYGHKEFLRTNGTH